MKHSIILAVVMLLQSTALVHAADAGPQAPIDAMVLAFNKGDVAGIHAAHVTGDVSLIDEVPPHLWHGPKAIDAWLTDLAAHDKARGRTDGVVTLSKPQVMTTQGNDGYAVVPAVYTFNEKGVPMRQSATMTFALRRGAGVWKVAGWSWNGTVPGRAKAK